MDYARKKPVKRYIWSIALYSAETWIFKKIEQTQLGIFKMWCWKRVKKISWANRVENKEVLQSQGEKEHHTYIKQRKAKLVVPCIGSTLLKHAEGKHINGKIKGIGRQGRRRDQLLHDLKETRHY